MAQRDEVAGATIARLSNTERLALEGYAARATWPSGFQIYERGASADGVFVVVRGRVVLRSRVRAGRGFVPWVATPGETFGAEGLSPSGVYATDARADDETETLFLSNGKLRAFIREQPAHALAVVGQVMAERTALLEKLRELTTLSVEQRLVAALRRMASHDSFTCSDGRIELCSARYRLLCELVGATRESVSLVLGRLTGEGLVERVGSTLYVMPSSRLFERLDDSGDDGLLVTSLADVATTTSALQ
ncbi:MAG: Crp/Fnr family transcriptional regulator [Gemmatimonadales bacterium]